MSTVNLLNVTNALSDEKSIVTRLDEHEHWAVATVNVVQFGATKFWNIKPQNYSTNHHKDLESKHADEVEMNPNHVE